jgi:hypothetical protein
MAPAHNSVEALLNEYDVARITGLSVASVRRWRLLRKGPRYLKNGSAVRYKAEDIAVWLESRPTGGERIPEARQWEKLRRSSVCAIGLVGTRTIEAGSLIEPVGPGAERPQRRLLRGVGVP